MLQAVALKMDSSPKHILHSLKNTPHFVLQTKTINTILVTTSILL